MFFMYSVELILTLTWFCLQEKLHQFVLVQMPHIWQLAAVIVTCAYSGLLLQLLLNHDESMWSVGAIVDCVFLGSLIVITTTDVCVVFGQSYCAKTSQAKG